MTDASNDFREMTDEDWAELGEVYRPRSMLLDVILDLRERGFTHAQISRELLFWALQEAEGVSSKDEASDLVCLFRFVAKSSSRQASHLEKLYGIVGEPGSDLAGTIPAGSA
jgi:hypothetical protein